MQIIKVTTYSRDSKDNVSDKTESFFADRAKALEFATSEGRTNGAYGNEAPQLENRHFWSDEVDNTFAAFDATKRTGDKLTLHAEISFHELN